MNQIRRRELVAGIALSCGMIFATTSFGQIVVRTDVSVGAPQHLGSGPIDRNNLPADILNCEVCRQRLGLPPLHASPSASSQSDRLIAPKLATPTRVPEPSKVPSPTPQAATARMLGSPGMISSVTAEQMALQGIVVEEFKPPQPDPNAIQLGELPPEVRQQFMRSLELPFGARVMSAEIRGQKADAAKVEGSETVTAQNIGNDSANQSEGPTVGEHRSLGAPGIETVLEATAADVSIQTKPLSKPPAEPTTAAQTQSDSADEQVQRQQAKEQLRLERELAKERESLKVQLEQMQFEWKKRFEQADAANKEVLTLLEKRTAEVTELQLQLKSQQEALAKAKQEAQSKGKPDGKRRVPNKGKKPAKPSIEI